MSNAPAAAAPKPAAPGASKVPLFALFVGVLNLGATGFVVARMVSPAHAAVAVAAAAGLVVGAEPKTSPAPQHVALDPLLVNLNEAGASRYLKATLEVEVADEGAATELKAASRAVRDLLLRYLSSLSVADTLGEHAKDKIGQEVVSRVDAEIGGKKRVRRLFFNEFMVQ